MTARTTRPYVAAGRFQAYVAAGLQACGLFLIGTFQASQPTLPELLKRGSDYVAGYAPKASGTILEEQFMIVEVSGDRMLPPRRISSDVVMVNINGRMISLRDAYAVDTKPRRDRTLRISDAIATLTQTSWTQAQEMARESFYLFSAAILIRASDPTLVFQFLDAATQPKLTYRLDGRKTFDNVQTLGVRYGEPLERNKTYHLGTRGNAAASGRFWIDPATGAVHQSELWLESPTEVARVTVTWGPDAARGHLVPKELSGTFEEREVGQGPPSSLTAINARVRFDCTAKYSNVRFRAIAAGAATSSPSQSPPAPLSRR
jgi:hypothetical protein